MKVILTQNVQKVGRKYEVVEVSDGYGLNFLIPQGKAKVATPGALREADKYKAAHEAEMKLQEELLAKNLDSLKEVTVTLKAKANEQGHLFAGIGAEDLTKALNDQKNIALDAAFIALSEPIKVLGEHTISVKAGEKEGSFSVIVEAE